MQGSTYCAKAGLILRWAGGIRETKVYVKWVDRVRRISKLYSGIDFGSARQCPHGAICCVIIETGAGNTGIDRVRNIPGKVVLVNDMVRSRRELLTLGLD